MSPLRPGSGQSTLKDSEWSGSYPHCVDGVVALADTTSQTQHKIAAWQSKIAKDPKVENIRHRSG